MWASFRHDYRQPRAMGAVALGRNSQRIALLSLFGGFLNADTRQAKARTRK